VESRRGLSIRIIAFAAFSAICYFGAGVIITLLLGILASYMLDPFVTILTRIKLPRGLAIAISMIAAGCVLAVLIAIFVDRAQDFSASLPTYTSRIQKVTRAIRTRIYQLEKKSEDISKSILPKTQEPQPIQTTEYSTLARFLFRDLGPFYDRLILASFFPFLVYFLLHEKDQIRNWFAGYIRSRTSLSRTLVMDTSDKILKDLNNKIEGFIFGYLLSTGILFLLSWLIFISFSVDGAFIWAVIFTLLGLLPFVGAILSSIPPVLIAITQFSSVQVSLLFIGVCLVLHLFYANWLIPRTTGRRTDLSPLVVIVAMMYWGFLWGAIGIFLAIPLTASLRSIWIQYRAIEMSNQPAEI